MTQYSDDLDRLMQTMFPAETFPNILGEVTSAANRTSCAWPKRRNIRTSPISQRRTGGAFSRRGSHHGAFTQGRHLRPAAGNVGARADGESRGAIDSGKYDLIVLNYANPDMVGHTGSLPAAIKAVETVDTGLGNIADAIQRAGGALLVTADHGNCEMMRDPATGGPHTAHTTGPVPLLLQGGGDRVIGGRPIGGHCPDVARLDAIAEAGRHDRRVLLRPQKRS
jgi:2,3-bisphosphoglycerate-independent phosphoglycerate mutase